ncbi:SAP30-binding protein-like [Schistocerca gregaria]|uniref:SAP30-binding protein-like n=1 Tax=Schistocerca gregaria TaxID=7010 RepID=UPI00211E51AF|nr:SAP30-binding protein-like [Schistocerca gregaria]XP_049848553.1 SAP30-binding protein-like [Schistocerca gregaria]
MRKSLTLVNYRPFDLDSGEDRLKKNYERRSPDYPTQQQPMALPQPPPDPPSEPQEKENSSNLDKVDLSDTSDAPSHCSTDFPSSTPSSCKKNFWHHIPPPSEPPRAAQVDQILKLLEWTKKNQKSINSYLRDTKEFYNPYLLTGMIKLCNINEFGTNYPKHLCNPDQLLECDYYENIVKMQEERERMRASNQKPGRRSAIDFVREMQTKKSSALLNSMANAASSSIGSHSAPNWSSPKSYQPHDPLPKKKR